MRRALVAGVLGICLLSVLVGSPARAGSDDTLTRLLIKKGIITASASHSTRSSFHLRGSWLHPPLKDEIIVDPVAGMTAFLPNPSDAIAQVWLQPLAWHFRAEHMTCLSTHLIRVRPKPPSRRAERADLA
jgi:hypothetical protein